MLLEDHATVPHATVVGLNFDGSQLFSVWFACLASVIRHVDGRIFVVEFGLRIVAAAARITHFLVIKL